MSQNNLDRSMQRMRRMVQVMGVVLVVGVIVLMYAVVRKIDRESKNKTHVEQARALAECFNDGVTMTLPTGTVVPPIITEGHMVTVTLYQPSGIYQIIAINRCTGKQINGLTLTPATLQ